MSLVHARFGGGVGKVSVQVVPNPNEMYSLMFASSSAETVIKPWGLVVGSLGSTPPGTEAASYAR